MAKVNISDTTAYKDFDMKHNRHLNMLQDTVSTLNHSPFYNTGP